MPLPLLFSLLAAVAAPGPDGELPPPPVFDGRDAAPVVVEPGAAPPAPVAAAPLAMAPAAAAPVAAPLPMNRRKVELLASLGLAVGGSGWSGDVLGYASLTLGVRLFRFVTPFGMLRMGYANVDQRLLTFLSLGMQFGYPVRNRAYPFLRLGFVHQHEESLAALVETPLGAVLGIGNAIRHRAGGQAALGCDFVVLRGARGELSLGPEVMLAYLGYSSGPNLYGSVGVQLGGSFTLF